MAKNRGKRRGGPVRNQAQPSAQADRYNKYLPEWMKENGGVAPRPPRVRRARQPRPAGGYTPGKFALNDTLQ
jgi:hypothetical protein